MLNIYELYLKQSRDELTFIQAFPFAARVFLGSPTHRWFWCPRTWHGTWTHSNALGIGDDSKGWSSLRCDLSFTVCFFEYKIFRQISWILIHPNSFQNMNHSNSIKTNPSKSSPLLPFPPKKGGFVASYRSNTVNSTPGSLVPSL